MTAGGFTLVEASITLIIICVLVALAAPLYTKAMEQARVDTAASTLRTVWSGQRVYWLEHRAFAPNLATLAAGDLVDRAVAESETQPGVMFAYRVSAAGDNSFTAVAVRRNSGVWTGQLEITEEGQVSGAITGRNGLTLSPPP